VLPILNRRGLERALGHAVGYVQRYGASVGVVVFDIDNFKQVNDWYGHVAGDEILQALCELLIAKVRSSDIVARWGGDELVVVLWHTSEAEAIQKANLLECAIDSVRVPVANHMLSVSVSTGVSMIAPQARRAKRLSAQISRCLLERKCGRRVVGSARVRRRSLDTTPRLSGYR